jgi:hypothetical protein
MIGYYFIQNKYIFVGNKEKDRDTDINGNDKYTKELTVKSGEPAYKPADESVSSIRIKESFDTVEDENENLIHNNKNKRANISMTYKKLLNYIF